MFVILYSVLFSLVVLSMVAFTLFNASSRLSSFKSFLHSSLRSLITSLGAKLLFFCLLVALFVINLIGNVPLSSIPTLFYSQTVTISLMFWVPLMICVSFTSINEFISHILPYGSPMGLMIILPLIEIFSQLIRPFTLIIRLSTNLSSGHIIMYIFSYFTLLSSTLAPFIDTVLFLLFILEICISILQAYIFVSLLALYYNETV